MDKGRTSTNGPENKKTNDDASGLICKRLYRLYESRKDGRGITSIEDSINILIQWLQDSIKKNKEILIKQLGTTQETTEQQLQENKNGKKSNIMG